jgi:cysteine synthase A
VDIFVAGVGTGGTITGVGEALKQRKAAGARRGRGARQGGGAVGLGAGATTSSRESAPASCRPSSTARWIDEIITVTEGRSLRVRAAAGARGGLLCGISSGAALAAAMAVAERSSSEGKLIVVMFARQRRALREHAALHRADGAHRR